MTTREKIIVGVMCLTIVYGAYELIGSKDGGNQSSPEAPKANPLEELRGFVSEVTQKMVKEKMSVEYQYMVERAGMNWVKDPFIAVGGLLRNEATVQKPAGKDSPSSAPPPDFLYTGFLQLGDKKLAVINGVEYAAGESLGVQGYYIRRITPDNVVLGRVNSTESLQLTIQDEY